MSTTPPPDPTPAPPAPPAAPEPQQSFLKVFQKHLLPEAGTPPVAEPTPPPPPAPPVTPPAAPTPPPEPPPPAPPPEPRKTRSDPLPAPPKEDFTPDPVAAPEAPDLAALLGYQPSAEEADYLEVLQDAAARDPQYQAAFEREVDRLKKVHKFVTDREAETGEELSETDPKFKQFLAANAPAVDRTTHRKLERAMIEARAEDRTRTAVMKELSPQLAKVNELAIKPALEKAQTSVQRAVLEALPKDDYLVEVAGSLSGEAALEKISAVPEEGPVLARAIQRGQETVTEYMRLRGKAAKFDGTNEVHVHISNTITAAGQFFAANGGKDRIRDGKTFLPPSEFNKLTPAAKGKHWTFADNEVVQIITAQTIIGAKSLLEEKRAALTKHDEMKKARSTPAKPPGTPPAPPPPPPSSPPLTPSPTGAPPAPPVVTNARTKSLLGLS